MWVGRYWVGWPGTGCQVLPESVLRNRLSRPIRETATLIVALALPLEPLRGSTRVTTIPLPRLARPLPPGAACAGWAPRPGCVGTAAGGASVTSGKLSTLLHVTAPSVLRHRPFWRVPR